MEFFQSWEPSLLVRPSEHCDGSEIMKNQRLGISDNENWATVTTAFKKGENRTEGVQDAQLQRNPRRYYGECPPRNYFQSEDKKVIRNNQHIYQRQILLVQLSCPFRLKWWLCRAVAAAHVDFSRVLPPSLPAFAVEADKLLAGGTACMSKMGRSSRLQRQGSIPACLLGSRWPQGLMLGPESFDSWNSRVSDVTGNNTQQIWGQR